MLSGHACAILYLCVPSLHAAFDDTDLNMHCLVAKRSRLVPEPLHNA